MGLLILSGLRKAVGRGKCAYNNCKFWDGTRECQCIGALRLRSLPRFARRAAPLRVTTPSAVLIFQFGPARVEGVERLLSRAQRSLRTYQTRGIGCVGWIFQFSTFSFY